MAAQTLTRTAAPAPAVDVDAALADLLVREIEQYLAARRRTAHPLVTATTEDLVRQALAELDTREAAEPGPAAPELPAGLWRILPAGLWRILPDRLLALHPGRLGAGVERLRVSVPEHLELTALVLERWGWARTGSRIRTGGGRRCILGAQRAVCALGYGTADTATAAGARIQNVLASRGIREPFPQWNELDHVDHNQVLALIRDAATED